MSTNTPSIRFKGFDDFWEQRKLEEVAKMIRGSFPQPYNNPEWFDEKRGKPFVQVADIDFNLKLFPQTKLHLSKIAEKKSRFVEKGTVVVALQGSIEKSIGRVAITQYPAFFDRTILIFESYYLEIDNPFFAQVIQNLFQIQKEKAWGATISTITKEAVNDFQIGIPQVTEQKKIGQFFQLLDQLINLQKRKVELLKKLKKGYLQKLLPVEGELTPTVRFGGYSWLWEWHELGKIGQTFTGLSGKTKDDFGHGNGKFITYMNVFSNPVADLDGLESVEVDNKQFQVRCGDVLFTTSSETPEEVGMSSVWLGNADNIYLNSFCFGYRPTIEFDKHYLAFMLRSAPIRKKFHLLAQGISRYNISKNKVMEMSVPVPNIAEQKVVGAFFKSLDQTIAFHQQKLENLQNLKKSYLQKMFI